MGDILAQCLNLLTQERQAIITARFDDLITLTSQRDILFAQITSVSIDSEKLDQIRVAMTRNQTLLAAAIAGVSDARNRLDALRAVRDGLHIYDQSGHVHTVHSDIPGVTRRA